MQTGIGTIWCPWSSNSTAWH